MKNDLDGVLVDWHRWAKGYTEVSSYGSCAMFVDVKSSRQWDETGEIRDGSLHNAEMKDVNFHIMELPDVQRTAIQIEARNLHTGRHVWISERLPKDKDERYAIVLSARNALMRSLGWL